MLHFWLSVVRLCVFLHFKSSLDSQLELKIWKEQGQLRGVLIKLRDRDYNLKSEALGFLDTFFQSEASFAKFSVRAC